MHVNIVLQYIYLNSVFIILNINQNSIPTDSDVEGKGDLNNDYDKLLQQRNSEMNMATQNPNPTPDFTRDFNQDSNSNQDRISLDLRG